MCDLCGESCDANTQELNVLSCTFKNCEDLPYHQDCLEKVGPAEGQELLQSECCCPMPTSAAQPGTTATAMLEHWCKGT